MDIHCRYCGEPWDHDELHDMYNHTYRQAAVAFKKYGCGAFKILGPQRICQHYAIYPPEVMNAIGAMQDMSPYPDEWSSPDEIAIMLEVAEEMF
jgi:hypothetical protein